MCLNKKKDMQGALGAPLLWGTYFSQIKAPHPFLLVQEQVVLATERRGPDASICSSRRKSTELTVHIFLHINFNKSGLLLKRSGLTSSRAPR